MQSQSKQKGEAGKGPAGMRTYSFMFSLSRCGSSETSVTGILTTIYEIIRKNYRQI